MLIQSYQNHNNILVILSIYIVGLHNIHLQSRLYIEIIYNFVI